jgi:hypothetical protein
MNEEAKTPVRAPEKRGGLGVKAFWRDYQWHILILLAAIAFACGYYGFLRHSTLCEQNITSYTSAVYLTLQLFTLESGSFFAQEQNRITAAFEIGRFLAPAVTVLAAVIALLSAFSRQVEFWKVKFFLKNHIIVCGLGLKGYHLAREFRRAGRQVIVIEANQENKFIESCREQGIFVVEGDATEPGVLAKAQILRAGHVISVCGKDLTNLTIATKAHESVQGKLKKNVGCFVHLVNPLLFDLVKVPRPVIDKDEKFRLVFANVHEAAARDLLQKYPAFADEKRLNPPETHVYIIGWSEITEYLIVRMANKWAAVYENPASKLKITIVARDAGRQLDSFARSSLKIPESCLLTAVEVDINSPDFLNGEFLFDEKGKCLASRVYVCASSEADNSTAGIAVNNLLEGYGVPVIVRITQSDNPLALLGGAAEIDTFRNLHFYTQFNQSENLNLFFSSFTETEELSKEEREKFAETIHNTYMIHSTMNQETGYSASALNKWHLLDEDFKTSSREYIEDLKNKLKKINCGIERLKDWDDILFELPAGQVEILAELEHERWMKEKIAKGWTYAEGEKDLDEKTSPYLIEWEKLPERGKEIDRVLIRVLPEMLARIGLRIYRKT